MFKTALAALMSSALVLSAAESPNIVYIMADELAYFEPGFMGGKMIQTPHLDQMAKEGMTFSQFLAGSSACAPTRCTLMTGKHTGHTSIRTNGGGVPLRADEVTIASMLKQKDYATGGFGKWGCGGRDSTGVPEKHGFDVFYGYYDQVHAHTHRPPFLIRNSEEVPFEGNSGIKRGPHYAPYLVHGEAIQFIRDHHERPFFCYLPITPPHGIFDIPDEDPAWALYKDKTWGAEEKRYAAMVTMLDRHVGEVLDLLKELKLDEKTLVIFCGDNGGADYFKSDEHPRGFFGANVHPETGVEFRGRKTELYEGGLRIPFVARWPGKIAPGTRSDHLGYFPDILPTIAELAGTTAPADIDGISILPTLTGQGEQRQHDHLYWEINSWRALRKGDWRIVQPKPTQPWELYDLAKDPSEKNDLATQMPEKLAELVAIADQATEPAVIGTFTKTDRHERDRRAKFGKQDDLNYDPSPGVKGPRVK